MTHFDVSLLVFLSAATLAHRNVSRENSEHAGIFHALIGVVVADVGTLVLYPNRGLLPLLFSLTTPGACLYGVCSTHGFRARLSVIVTCAFALASWLCSFIDAAAYPWAILGSWSVLAGISWVCLLDPEKTPTGITRFAAVALAASLLADLPGVYVWARYGTWRAESVITSLSVTILATMPMLWKLWTCRRSLSERSYSASGSLSGEEAEARPSKPCE